MHMAESDIDIEGLARRMRESDEEAYREFACYFGPRFRSFFLRRGLQLGDAEDLAVSCVTDIALKVEKYRAVDGGAFEAWVFTLARQSLLDWWRAHRYTEPLSENPASELPAQDAFENNTELISAVIDALAQLSEDDRAVIQAIEFSGEQTFAEAGKTLGLSEGRVRARHYRALKRLQAILERDERIIRYLVRRNSPNSEKSHE